MGSALHTGADADLTPVFQENERYLWALSYRMTGSAADADDVVQETFVRAMQKPPVDLSRPWRPWLVKVAVNLSRDSLRRRRRAPYTGVWLPQPIETGEECSPPSHEVQLHDGSTTEHRYDLLESVSFAFLVALEALTPAQRAVLLLRDVFDYSVRETADALDMTEANVKTTHHRARKAMAAYEANRCVPTRALQDRTREGLSELMGALVSHDTARMEALLVRDAVASSDADGEFVSALNPILGATNVVKFYTSAKVRRHSMGGADAGFGSFEVRMINGLPAFVAVLPAAPRQAERIVLVCTPSPDGRFARLDTVAATPKLRGIRFD